MRRTPPQESGGWTQRSRDSEALRWQRTKVREGEVGCFFDEIGNLVEPTERPDMGEPHAGERRDMEGAAGPGAKQDCAATRGGLGRSEAGCRRVAVRVEPLIGGRQSEGVRGFMVVFP